MNNESGHEPAHDGEAGSSMGAWMTIGFWVIMLGFGVVAAQKYLDETREADPPTLIKADGTSGPAVILDSTRRGHYRVKGYVNGHAVNFLVDTGATEVSIPASVADKIGLRRGEAGYATTANGVATIYDTEIKTLNIGPLQRFDVPAHISPGLTDSEALLGMSFLRHFDLVQRGNQLQIQTP